eukprot:m.12280 g.12280  ORF g.12280 m.12280 type:complete len:65 (+) comp5816_c0_seq1:634-828(+)
MRPFVVVLFTVLIGESVHEQSVDSDRYQVVCNTLPYRVDVTIFFAVFLSVELHSQEPHEHNLWF